MWLVNFDRSIWLDHKWTKITCCGRLSPRFFPVSIVRAWLRPRLVGIRVEERTVAGPKDDSTASRPTAVGEVAIEDVRTNFETNVFGTLSVIQAALPLLRAQGNGHILPVSSVGGMVANQPQAFTKARMRAGSHGGGACGRSGGLRDQGYDH